MNKKFKLSNQLIWLVASVFLILVISLGIILPRVLIPVAEANVYSYLSEPLKFIDKNVDKSLLNTEIAYIDITNNYISTSQNIKKILKTNNIELVLSKINNNYGKFTLNNNTYYYSVIKRSNSILFAITNSYYINNTKAKMLGSIIPIVLFTFILISLLLLLWSTMLVKKIEKVKTTIDNIDNPNYKDNITFDINDEMKSLLLAIQDMKISLNNTEELKNQMYQNISHDFKTPLTVIKSHIEAIEDKYLSNEEGLKIIKEQTNKLEDKVRTLLYLNKLDYLKNTEVKIVNININEIIKNEIKKFKYLNKKIKFIDKLDEKAKFKGTVDNWETILDNILNNFIRYAKTKIKITSKTNKLILYNDGDNIDNNLLEGIFNPYRKGVKGQFGLGLSIVKKTLNMMNYDIKIKNEKVGVSFIIYKSK